MISLGGSVPQNGGWRAVGGLRLDDECWCKHRNLSNSAAKQPVFRADHFTEAIMEVLHHLTNLSIFHLTNTSRCECKMAVFCWCLVAQASNARPKPTSWRCVAISRACAHARRIPVLALIVVEAAGTSVAPYRRFDPPPPSCLINDETASHNLLVIRG